VGSGTSDCVDDDLGSCDDMPIIEDSTFVGCAGLRDGARGGKGGGCLSVLGPCVYDVIFLGQVLGGQATYSTSNMHATDLYEVNVGSAF
jgi:hypothetical protein